MKDGMFVFDATVHCQDFTDRQIRPDDDGRHVRALRSLLGEFTTQTAARGPSVESAFPELPDLDWANRKLFDESVTDLAMSCTVPLYSHWQMGLGSPEVSHALAASNPSRILFTGGVDPAFQGLDAALEEME